MDEYAEGDPYSVESNLDSTFHRNRISITCDLVGLAVEQMGLEAKVLDVGAGEGHITNRFCTVRNVAEVVALDASLSASVRGKVLHPQLEYVVADAYDIPYADGYFDVVVLNNIWEHLPDPLRMLAEMKRVCRHKGYVIISTPSRYRAGNLARVLLGKEVTFMSTQHVTEYTVGQVRELLAYGGFEVVEVRSRAIPDVTIKGRVVQKAMAAVVTAFHSHHRLDPTVFYLARNVRRAGTQI